MYKNEYKIMDLDEYLDNYSSMSKKEMTQRFNDLCVGDRRTFLELFDDIDIKEKFVKEIRTQAVADFWTHEKELIKQGLCTRDWTPEQIEAIMNISEKTGVESINGHIAYDINGKAYYGHHMISVEEHPEYAGDWRNVQALDYIEHYEGAHDHHKTQISAKGFYNVETGETKIIAIPSEDEFKEFKVIFIKNHMTTMSYLRKVN